MLNNGTSEVARLKQQIEAEYTAAQLAQRGLALGVAQHKFISRRMECVGESHENLKGLIGDDATLFLIGVMDKEVIQTKYEH